MRKIWIVISVIVIILIFQGCGSETTYWQNWEAPNWTSDGKIVFLEDSGEQKINSWGDMVGGNQTITLYEIDEDGNNLQQTGEIVSCSFESGRVLVPMSTSSAGNWVILSIEDWRRGDHYPVVYTIKRNGDSLSEIGSGKYPDFSPDASQIVYEKTDEGIWIMDRDGGNDHQIISDGGGVAWSPEGGRIAYVSGELFISDTLGSILDSLGGWKICPDWSTSDTNKLMASSSNPYWILIISLDNYEIDTLPITGSHYVKWSPDGRNIIEYDVEGYYVIDTTGTNKWILNP